MTPKISVNRILSLPLDRGQLLKGLSVAGSLMALGGPGRVVEALAADVPVTGNSSGELPRRALGKTGLQVSVPAAIVMIIVRFAPALIGLVQPVSSQMLFIDLVIGLIVIFGIGYMLAAHDLSRFWPCVALGITGKSLFVVLIFSYFGVGLIGPVLAVLVCGDLVFTVLFHRLLERHAQTEEFPYV